ncbi:MAG: hypothetical protein ACT6RD_11045 [Brevundimonas sp.]|uniref:hypothetical protein n=1 Tax=Brevundimonas sp. TaxID=1871086 RepID=UPI0040344574
MTRPVGPVGAAGQTGAAPTVPDPRDVQEDRRLVDRRKSERRAPSRRKTKTADGEASAGRDLVPVGAPVTHDPAPAQKPSQPAAAEAAFAAQLLGQSGQKRGLRGGPPVLDAARSTYLGAEYAGEKDRRPPVGKATKTEI